MIIQHIYIPRYAWSADIYYAVTDYYTDDIIAALTAIHCPDDFLLASERNLRSRHLNNGITYSNGRLRHSVMVIGLADSPKQYDNSIAHERAHLVTHIASTDGMSLTGEEICYLTGDIAQQMHPVSCRLTCPCCFPHTKKSPDSKPLSRHHAR